MKDWGNEENCAHEKCMWGYFDIDIKMYLSYKQEAFFCVTCGKIFKTRNITLHGLREHEKVEEKHYKEKIDMEYGKI